MFPPCRRVVLIAAAVLAPTACAPDAPTAPVREGAAAPRLSLDALSSVLTVQLRAVPPNPVLPPLPIYGWGSLQLKINVAPGDACVPPNPVTPPDGMTAVAVCGRIFNEGGALYRGGGIYSTVATSDGTPFLVAAFNGAIPNDPYHRYELSGETLVTDAVAADMAAHPGGYQVRMWGQMPDATTQSIGGLLDGSAWGPVGDKSETDPYFADKVASILITP